jgi:hydroxymethylbilane synthase
MSHRRLRIGTRGSELALAQTDLIVKLLQAQDPTLEIDAIVIKTAGDKDQSSSLAQMGGVGVFTKALESALLNNDVDMAVHSAKDLPAGTTSGLRLVAVPARESCEDILLSRNGWKLDELPAGSKIGTGSPRRNAQLLYHRRDLGVTGIRGNVPTRLKKLADGEYDAIVMAHAGLKRLGLEERITEVLPISEFLPAPGQGFLAVQIRDDDDESRKIVSKIDDKEAHRCLDVERGLMLGLNAGCSAAVGGWARTENDKLQFTAVVLDSEGKHRVFAEGEIRLDDDEADLVEMVTKKLLSQGARELIG